MKARVSKTDRLFRAKHFDGPPKYLGQVLALAEAMEYPPGLHHINVFHDEWCDLILGRGMCNCNPVVKPLTGGTA